MLSKHTRIFNLDEYSCRSFNVVLLSNAYIRNAHMQVPMENEVTSAY